LADSSDNFCVNCGNGIHAVGPDVKRKTRTPKHNNGSGLRDDRSRFIINYISADYTKSKRDEDFTTMSLSLSPQIQKIIDDWQYHKLVLPSWFVKNNINWVISGHITESEFLSGFSNLLNSGIAYYIPEPQPQPEPQPAPPPA